MKLKKRQFTKLQQIAFTVNQILPGTGVQLDKLIADIESVQKPKEEFGFFDADQLKKDFSSGSPFYESLKEEARDIFFKEGKNAVENSLSDRRSTKGIRNKLRNLDPSICRKINGVMDVETGSDLEKFLDPLIAPQIGDIGYFWDDRYPNVLYTGILSETKIDGSGKVVYYGLKNKNISKDAALFGYFSKTPPELI